MAIKKYLVPLVTVTSLALSLVVFNHAQAEPLRNGFYVGAGVSANWLHLDGSRYVSYHNIESTAPLPTIYFSGNSKAAIGIHFKAGYQKIFDNNFYLAAELSYDIAHNKESLSLIKWPHYSSNFQTSGEIKRYYSLDLLLGYAFAKSTAAYLRLGITYTPSYFNFEKIDSDTNYLKENSQNKKSFGPRIGVGLVHQLSKNFLLNLDYVYTFHSSSKYSDKIGIDPTNPSRYTMSNKSYRLRGQQVVLSLSYIF